MATPLSSRQFADYLRTGAVSPDPAPPLSAGKARDFNTIYAELRAGRGDRKAHQTRKTQAAPARKAGRAFSQANRETITNALDGMTEHMNGLMEHHGVLTDLMRKTDPDAVRQDEYDIEGDDDTENGGHNINKSTDPDVILREIASLTRRLEAIQQQKQLQRSMDQLSRKMALGSVRRSVKQLLALAREHPEEMRPGQRLRDLLSNTPNAAHALAAHKSQALTAVATLQQLAPELVGASSQADMVPIAGYLSTFGNEDYGGDICDSGCFTQTLADMKQHQARTGSKFLIPMLWMHDMAQPIGGWTSLEQDGIGLFALGLIDPDTEMGAQVLSMLSKAYVCGLSIGYTVVRSSRDGQGVRHLQQIDLAEGSVVTLPMNPLATVTKLD